MVLNIWTDIIPVWLTAIGTVSAVIVAIFGRTIREWRCRPKIDITIDKKPCIETKETESDSSDKDKIIQIRIKLVNNGKSVANHAVLNVDSYYEKRAKSDEYVKKEFTPQMMKDYRGSLPKIIAPHLTYYYDIAVVQKADGMTKNDSNEKAKQLYRLFLLGDNITTKLGKGTFIIPLKFYSAKTETIISNLKIYWDSDDYSVNTINFDVKILSDKEFNELKFAQ